MTNNNMYAIHDKEICNDNLRKKNKELHQQVATLTEQAEKDKNLIQDMVMVAQKYQPAGSPPPGDASILLLYILQSLTEQLRQAEETIETYRQYLMKMGIVTIVSSDSTRVAKEGG
jgi:chaperonin cofactor prefoldin